ncbi:hemin uptake protein HemP [Ramlibacter terrae]|uniref:Hemin uptake protein HemP n=1 Tax=Ramlibacter terrae TaxID=2732511 RepID=A0ABX6P3X2_9BURK|nr:hemin uptake protein HemP [Ramlibacter terrae]
MNTLNLDGFRAPSSPMPPAAEPPEQESRPASVRSEDLLRGRRLVEISHNGEVYRLQATRLGKLILTK